ncbi:MAG: hypothetical protein GX950_02015 [Candidatus Diapherotrites archaeon]|uniref:Flippase-like domain-containing protein n=1 Tax=Candidatus Iainarchaeum sp. TaxID=3101447 RepID=A0A7K4BZE0_9ARCH|nr:hypothetical protein [Candidatus Diapherotrites archaeon]
MFWDFFVFEELDYKKLGVLSFFVLLMFFVFGFVLSVPIYLSFVCFVFFVLFFVSKTISFFVVLPKKFSFIEVLGVFFISDFVELITFTGKIGADTAKVFFFKKKVSLKQLIKSIAIFRTAIFVSTGLIILILINFWFVGLVLFLILLYFSKFREVSVSVFFNLISDIFRVTLFAFLLIQFNVPINNFVLLGFLGASIFARLFFFIPQGLIVQDSAIGVLLTKILSVGEIVQINIILRFFTIIPSAILGGLIVSDKSIKKIKNLIKKRKKTKNFWKK